MTEGKSPEGQDYRDWMAKKIRERRASGEDDVAYTLLQEAKKVGDYYKSLRPDRLKKQKVRIEAVYSMIENGDEEFIAENLNKGYFENLDKGVANKLIEKGYGSNVAGNIAYFKKEDHKEIAKDLILKDSKNFKEKYGMHRFHHFEGLDKEIANLFIEAGYSQFVANNPRIFSGLDDEIANKLRNKGFGKLVEKNSQRFGLEK